MVAVDVGSITRNTPTKSSGGGNIAPLKRPETKQPPIATASTRLINRPVSSVAKPTAKSNGCQSIATKGKNGGKENRRYNKRNLPAMGTGDAPLPVASPTSKNSNMSTQQRKVAFVSTAKECSEVSALRRSLRETVTP